MNGSSRATKGIDTGDHTASPTTIAAIAAAVTVAAMVWTSASSARARGRSSAISTGTSACCVAPETALRTNDTIANARKKASVAAVAPSMRATAIGMRKAGAWPRIVAIVVEADLIQIGSTVAKRREFNAVELL